MNYDTNFLKELERLLPPFFRRADAGKATYGTVTAGYLAYLASVGGGPKYTKVRGKAVYTKQDFIDWLKEKRHGGEQFHIKDDEFGRTAYTEQVPAEIFAGTTGDAEE